MKIKEKAEILAHGYFEKRGNQLKRGTLTPLTRMNIMVASVIVYFSYLIIKHTNYNKIYTHF